MQSALLNCDKEMGTVEITLSKREASLENVLICADYKRIDTDKYEVNFYCGFTDVDIMMGFGSFTWNVEYSHIKGCIVDYFKEKLKDSKFMKELRKELRLMRNDKEVEFDYVWKIVKYFPEKEATGFDNVEITVEFNDEQAKFYITGKNENQYMIDKIQFSDEEAVSTESKVFKISQYVKDALLKEEKLCKFIYGNLNELGLQEEI